MSLMSGLRYISSKEITLNPLRWLLSVLGFVGLFGAVYGIIASLLELEIIAAIFFAVVGYISFVWIAFCLWTKSTDHVYPARK